MQFTRKAFVISMSAAFLALGACGGPSGGGSQVSREEQLRRGVNANPDSVDPHKAQGTWENDIIGDMFIGLFTEDAASKPIPGVAESWTTSEDGLTWTFKLKHTNWSDGVPLTANDFVFSLRRMLNPKTLGAVYASILYPIKNAQAVNSGKMPPEQLGVRAVDDYTLEIQLENPMPYLPALLKHYTAYPVPQHVVEKYGDDWTRPEHIVVNGPYKLVEWRSGDYLRSVKNDAFADAANVCFKQIIYFTQSDHDAMVRRAQAGEIDMNSSFPSGQLAETEQKLPGWPRVSPMMATTYTVTNTTKPPFDDKRVRQAVAMAEDREYITKSILKGRQIPAYNFVPPGMNGYPHPAEFRWKDEPRAQRLKEAVALLQQAGYGPDKPLEFEYLYRASGDNPRIAPVLQANWQDIAPWVHPQIRQVETKDLYKQEQEQDFTIADSGWVVDYNDPYNFLYLMDSRTGPMNYGQYKNPAYDDLLDKALKQTDTAERTKYLEQADQMMLDDTAVIPLLTRVTQDIVNPDITGYVDNIEDIHRSRYMCRKGLKAG
ncbi:MAG: peptide ABC transporter substrate-binding protein [Alphaproteobacteria bacterium]|nr:peptide ABC transporter substrate-binding protein [Alphaproteobacteria bacterium]